MLTKEEGEFGNKLSILSDHVLSEHVKTLFGQECHDVNDIIKRNQKLIDAPFGLTTKDER